MKISVLTFSKEINFGANLQCYALCKTLQNMGHKVDIIDIQLAPYSMSWYSAVFRIPRLWLFRQFRKQHLNIFTRHYNSVDELKHDCPKSDLYIVGSDQVWNPGITKRLDPLVYFFSFLPVDARRISYAASFGTETWQNPEITDDVKRLLSKFDAVSVREDNAVQICKETFNVDATQVLDPTLLLTSYDEICGQYDKRKETQELLYYELGRYAETKKILADFAEDNKLQAVYLCSNRKYPRFKKKQYVSVAGWLNEIRYSRIVVTSSFHCMVFCLIFHKKFVAIQGHKSRSSRQKSLLNKLGLAEFFCDDTSKLYQTVKLALETDIDYQKVDEELKLLRKDSLAFLERVLSK
ncbi:MAG: polysaccharide pyruvyl transferase family protein [Prevotella sp.]|nr:polysaccharide pyruvyl transferase family protein [Prevotella sp.]